MESTFRTIDDLAWACGVSRQALSKLLDDPSSVRTATPARIEAALPASDYQPNHFARNLNCKRARGVGIIVTTITDLFYAEMASRLELRLRDEEFRPIVISSQGTPEADAIRIVSSLKVADGIVARLGAAPDRRAFEKLNLSIPLVYMDNDIEGETPHFGNNNAHNIRITIDYICRSGEQPTYSDIRM